LKAASIGLQPAMPEVLRPRYQLRDAAPHCERQADSASGMARGIFTPLRALLHLTEVLS